MSALPPFDQHATFHLTSPPHPTWTPGTHQPAPASHGSTVSIDPAALAKPDMYKLIISAVVPRPIALVSTVDAETGVVNVAPYSYFNVVCHDPPTLMISVNAGRTGPKDTLRNILSTSQLVINTFSEWTAESANHTTTPYPASVSELPSSALTPVASELVRPPRIAESAVSFECRVAHVNMLHNKDGKATAGVVLAEVVRVHVKEGVYDREKGIVDLAELRPLGRLGGTMYGRVVSGFELHRPATVVAETKEAREVQEGKLAVAEQARN
ncbi:uncharacterized protein EV422DRAFT_428628 [Fimicolochytrium jonesii]|uniref:uncharacterized protein n=1 Tax=Fimicolochytrium jonesii TaxID=1396493 RepID=UPI0022FEE318|nr:uncharacterized protein EV422DRAFT_428628 [Fimicolochytrium jonesii]KAI8821690.1 hypothetical protein EV422DRAFT_428628 [Fimicolochytrium jonesii]